MKKLIQLTSFTFLIFILSSCGPSACDCYENYSYGPFSSTGISQSCIKKFGGDIPDKYRGTNKFSEEMTCILSKKCSNWGDYHRPSDNVQPCK